MKARKNLFIFFSLFLLISIIYFAQSNFILSKNENEEIEKNTKIAVCPTYYHLEEKINKEKIELIKTNSTAESINLLKEKKVEAILTGRLLKPNEPFFDFLVIGKEGYSFLNQSEKIIFEEDLKKYSIYTDLNLEEIKSNFSTDQVFAVENVYDFLDQGIVITSWENTNYSKAKIVHLLEKNGKRNILSRRLNLYCSTSCQIPKMQELALFLKQF